jgi:polysaccharide biosynthesis protein PslH
MDTMSTHQVIPTDVSRRLRILVVSPCFACPPTSGGEVRIYQLIRQLAKRHDVSVIGYATDDSDVDVRELGDSLTVRAVHRNVETHLGRRVAQLRSLGTWKPFASSALASREMQAAVDELCGSIDFDLIHVEFSTMCNFRFPEGIPVVIDEHNVEYELRRRLARGEPSALRRAFNGLEYLRLRRFEERCWNQAQGCVVTSDREVPIIKTAAPSTPTAVAPNGVDLEYFAPWEGDTQPYSVVFNGVLNYRPNVDAAMHLVHEIWPLVLQRCPSARLTLVGNAPEREARGLRQSTVDVVGSVPDIRPYLGAAEAIVVPIRMGGGTRFKVVEALSMGKPIVSTTVGAEGLAVRDREHLLIADDPVTFAGRILELFDDPALRLRLGRSGRSLAEHCFSWQLSGNRLEELYRRVLTDRAASAVLAAHLERVHA